MFAATIRRSFWAAPARVFIATAIVVGALAATAVATDATDSTTIDPRLKALVERHLQSKPDYQRGDLLSRGDVEPIFNELIDLGIQPTRDGEGLFRHYLRDDDHLVQLFESPRGRAFMRKVNQLPDAYDRLERLSWSPAGRQWLRQMVDAENGDKLFADLLTEQGVKLVVETLKDDPSGSNFALPTGHVHTADELLARLQRAIASQCPKSTASVEK